MTRQEAIEKTARYIYDDSARRRCKTIVGWSREPADVKAEWLEDVSRTITFYEQCREQEG